MLWIVIGVYSAKKWDFGFLAERGTIADKIAPLATFLYNPHFRFKPLAGASTFQLKKLVRPQKNNFSKILR